MSITPTVSCISGCPLGKLLMKKYAGFDKNLLTHGMDRFLEKLPFNAAALAEVQHNEYLKNKRL